jgi:hypothetical protein
LKKTAEGDEEIRVKDWSDEALTIDKNTEDVVTEKKW